ncbi:hypothetical protein HY449_01235 [Candidatus Pacearchaeota archaeon]|nr:hypothetical protein [Candidatus Pacearchaeota archaeon]
MKITICGSMAFYEEMLRTKSQLEKMSHEVRIPIEGFADENGNLLSVEHYNQLRKNLQIAPEEYGSKKRVDILEHFEKIKWSNSILVANFDKKNIANYIGANTLMEMGLALYLQKGIYLLNPVPDVPYQTEILGTLPKILNGDLSLIK